MSKVAICFWGTRGSIPVPGTKTTKYGGNTACVEVRFGRNLFICDAGTGIRNLGLALVSRRRSRRLTATLLLTHTHWDHVIGLPFFAPLYTRQAKVTICGPAPAGRTIREVIASLMGPEFFPCQLHSLPARIVFRTVDGNTLKINGVEIEPVPICHPGTAVCWAFHFPGGKKFVYVSDNELGSPASRHRQWLKQFTAAIRGSDLLVHDAQYTNREYGKRAGWGHSTYDRVVDLAIATDVRRLVFFHHDPSHGDRALEIALAKSRVRIQRAGSRMRCHLAQEGKTITI